MVGLLLGLKLGLSDCIIMDGKSLGDKLGELEGIMDREAFGVSVEGAPSGELEGARVLVRYSDG